jgi:hypothetical protein
MTRTAFAAIFAIGMAVGAAGMAAWWPVAVLEAQGAWQCRSWTLEEKGDAGALGTWLGTTSTSNVLMTSAGLSAGSRFAVVTCKR